MVEVLNKGNGTKECTCGNCGSHLRYKPSEARDKKINADYLGDYDLAKAIVCPECGEDVIVAKG